MLGNQKYKIDVNAELSNERLKSLVLFYGPLVGHDALALYQYLVLKGSTIGFADISDLLASLNISVDAFEEQCGKLNEYRLLKTLKQDDKYVFIFNNPLTAKEFVKDNILQREFILKTSGSHYNELIADIRSENTHEGFEDVSRKLSLSEINKWSKENETFLNKDEKSDSYNFNTLFDMNVFLKDVSIYLFPLKFRTPDILKEIATLADLYNISYDKMRTYIQKVCSLDSNEFDLDKLKYLCMDAVQEYKKVDDGNYNVPCLLFLMNKQNGKEATEYDKNILRTLSKEYHLCTSVINVLIEHALKACDNRLFEKYIYSIAADFHRNNINDAKSALSRLDKPYNKNTSKDELPTYGKASSAGMSIEEEEELLRMIGRK